MKTTTTTRGTSHFASKLSAYKYYATYGIDGDGVRAKIEAGEITIGQPKLADNETCVINSEGRYVVTTTEPAKSLRHVFYSIGRANAHGQRTVKGKESSPELGHGGTVTAYMWVTGHAAQTGGCQKAEFDSAYSDRWNAGQQQPTYAAVPRYAGISEAEALAAGYTHWLHEID
jgi:hypothetical protein